MIKYLLPILSLLILISFIAPVAVMACPPPYSYYSPPAPEPSPTAAQIEAERQRTLELERQRIAEEQRIASEAEAKRIAEAEAKRKAEEEARRKAEEEARKAEESRQQALSTQISPVDFHPPINGEIDQYLAVAKGFINGKDVENTINTRVSDIETDFTVAPAGQDASVDQIDQRNQEQKEKNNEAQQLLNEKILPYFDGSEDKIKEMLSAAQDFDKNSASLAAYFGHVNEFHEFFLEDMKNEPERFGVDVYMRDFDSLKESIVNELEDINAEKPDIDLNLANSEVFDPLQFLDKGIVPPTDLNLRFTILQPLNIDPRLNTTLISMLSTLRNKFADDNRLTAQVDFFLNKFPASAENIVMDSADTQIFDTLGNAKQIGALSKGNFSVDEFGAIVRTEATSQNTQLVGDRTQGRFNNRSFGYRLQDGNHPSIEVTIGNSRYRLHDNVFTSPLVLDMNNDGKLEASNGEWLPHNYNNSRVVEFDIDGDNFVDITEWVGPNDGLLVANVKEGVSINANSLFGEAGGFINGFEKLSLLDADKNTVISGAELETLSVWQDKNLNAQIDAGELTSVVDLGITEINTNHEKYVSSFVRNGEEVTMWDWYPSYFQVKKQK